MPEPQTSEATPSGGESTAQLEALQSQLSELQGQVKDQTARADKLQTQVDDELFADDYLKGNGTPEEPAPSENTSQQPEINIDSMTPSQIVEHLKGEIAKSEQRAIESGNTVGQATLDRLGKLEWDLDLEMGKINLPGLRDKLANDSEYQKEFVEVANANRTWKTAQVYNQVEMVRNHRASLKDKADAEKADRELAAATEKVGVPVDGTRAKELEPGEAEELAYRKVYGNKSPTGV